MGDVNARGYFITGTDTGVGKTVFTSQLARFLTANPGAAESVAAYKPACSGAEYRTGETPVWADVEALFAATGESFPRERIGPQTFLAPLSPPAAAAMEDREVDEGLLVEGYRWLAERAEIVLVEGAGGFYSPISTNWLNADLAQRIGLPVIIVAPHRLGTINQTLLTIEAIRHRGLKIAGVVLNQLSPAPDASIASNADEIRQRGNIRLWGTLAFGGGWSGDTQSIWHSMQAEVRMH